MKLTKAKKSSNFKTKKYQKKKITTNKNKSNINDDDKNNTEIHLSRKARKEAKIEEHKKTLEDKEIKKSDLINILTMTVKNPSKATEGLCKQLRKIFMPNSLNKIEINPKMQDVIDISDQLLVTQVVYLSKDEIKIAVMPKGPTYTFKIDEYDNNYKNFTMDLYKEPAFITTEGKCSYKNIFECLGTGEGEFKRALHFYFKNDLVYMRHYCTSTEDLEDKFKVCLREIGPRLTLKLMKLEDGIFPEMKIKKTKFYMKNKEENL